MSNRKILIGAYWPYHVGRLPVGQKFWFFGREYKRVNGPWGVGGEDVQTGTQMFLDPLDVCHVYLTYLVPSWWAQALRYRGKHLTKR